MVAADQDGISVLTAAFDRFLAGEPIETGVRKPVLASWRRCQSLGIAADNVPILYHQDLDLNGSLAHAALPVLTELESRLTGMDVSVVLCDEQARILQRGLADPSLNRWLDTLQLAPGFAFAEQITGTNGMGTALAERRPAFICGREHYADVMRMFACAAAPIRDPISGRVQGALDLTCLHEDSDPSMLALVHDAATKIEQRLLAQISQRERALLQTYLEVRRRAHRTSAAIVPVDTDQPIGVNVSDIHLLTPHDQLVLREKAAELISAGRMDVVVVRLSGGRTATLLSRPIESPTGESGIAVEAVLPGDALWRAASATGPAPPVFSDTRAGWRAWSPAEVGTSASTPSSHALVPSVPLAPAAVPSRITDGWLLAVGEPGVGQVALRARERLGLLCDASVRLGTTLEVTRTAEELTQVAVPRFADYVAVDVPDCVLRGDEPTTMSLGTRRIALRAIREGSHLHPVGALIHPAPSTPQAHSLASEEPVLEPTLDTAFGWMAQDPVRTQRIREHGIHSLITVPMRARGVTLGVVSFYRSQQSGAFEEDDLSLAEELVSRAAVCVDNARRYTRERTMSLALQRSLLPRGLPEQNAVEIAHRYLPAQGEVGGDWFDVIPLSGMRVALVVGDVVGHGLHASATMGCLRTAVHNFSDLDLPVNEILAHLDNLVARLDLDEERDDQQGDRAGILGATCLYTIYDPVSRCCTMARAGHLAPALLLPDGTVEFPEVPAGPPLGVGGLPFETADIQVPEGSLLVLYTDGLIEDRRRDIDVGLESLHRTLAQHPGRAPEHTCEALLSELLPPQPSDDVALLVARTRALPPDQVATWDLPSEPAAVSRLRGEVTERLAAWGLEELQFTTELMLSELMTNAIRYGQDPITVRLLRDRSLICEVSDCSGTSPRLRQAASTDEGGRGLFLVAQLANRWGTRHTTTGKVIWAEQPLLSPAA
ncbi:SpoIIE family protein phosphatase [Nonomuraea sp. NPDC050153]|uniref:SpoIIE family protein phosphatase n=1 Tax=Nonomuraea sp. NPDC050153 TaxID=3364359 RepID=UPI0037AC9AA2